MTESAKEDMNVENKGVMLFGVDLMRIECLRGSLLNGYAGAAVGGIGGFMFSSKWNIACHSAFGSFWVVAFSSWFLCRYRKYRREKDWNHIKERMNEKLELSPDEYHLPRGLRDVKENVETKQGIQQEKES